MIYGAFSRNHFMEGCFMFQWGGGGGCFSDGGDLIFKWGGCPMGGISFDDGGGVRKKLLDGRGCPHALPTMGNPVGALCIS